MLLCIVIQVLNLGHQWRVREESVFEERVGEDRIPGERVGEDRVGEDRVGEERVGENRVVEDRVGEERVSGRWWIGLCKNSPGITFVNINYFTLHNSFVFLLQT